MNQYHAQWTQRFRSYSEYSLWLEKNGSVLDEQWRGTLELQTRLAGRTTASVAGYCWVCGKDSSFAYDLKYSHGPNVNWRERLTCSQCGLNNRLRLTVQVLELLGVGPRGYLTEYVTPLSELMSKRYPGLVTSEYLGSNLAPGQRTPQGIRHEDLTRLSMPDSCLDFVVSCDVLEHIPDYSSALREIHRVLAPGGLALLTAPFAQNSASNIIRAKIVSGQIEHLLEPEYHGDPVGAGGILCFYHFGWELLDDLKRAGFEDPSVHLYWSAEYANLGASQAFFVARR